MRRSLTTTLSSHSRVGANASPGGTSTNGLRLLDLRTECALELRLISDCLQTGLDTTPTQFPTRAQQSRGVRPLRDGMQNRQGGLSASVCTVRIGRDVCALHAPLEYGEDGLVNVVSTVLIKDTR